MNFFILKKRLRKFSNVICFPLFWRVVLLNRVLAGVEHRPIIGKGLRTVVDIGANRGQFTLAVRRWGRNAQVIAFEPLQLAASIFQNIFKEDRKVIFHQAAIGQKSGEAKIHVSAADDSSSLYPFSPIQEQLFPGTSEVRTELVKIGPLSNFVKPDEITAPAMLKLDVQGYELEALKGCENLLGCFNYVYVECSFVELYIGQASADEVVSWLQQREFRLNGVYNIDYDRNGRAVQGDFLFLKWEKKK